MLRHPDDLAREARLVRALLAYTRDGVVLLDHNLSFTYASAAAVQLFGVPLENLLARNALDVVHPDDRETIRRRLDDVLAAPRTFVAASFRIVRPDGEVRWIDTETSNLLDDVDVAAIVGKYRDVTEQREADALHRTMRGQLERLSRAIQQTADAVIVTARNGVIEYVNPAFEQITGYTSAEAVGHTPRLLSSGRQGRTFYETLWKTILSGSAYRTVLTNKRKDGTLYDEDQTIAPIRDATGAITHFVSTGRDITNAG